MYLANEMLVKKLMHVSKQNLLLKNRSMEMLRPQFKQRRFAGNVCQGLSLAVCANVQNVQAH